MASFFNNEYNDIFISNYKEYSDDYLHCLTRKVSFKSLIQNYKLPLDLIERYLNYFDLEEILTHQILNIEEIVMLFKIYEVDVKQVDKFEYYILMYQLPNVDSDIMERIKMMLELTNDI